MATKPRVLLLHNYLSPYRVPLFALLANEMDLTVWLMGDVRGFREWPVEVPEDAFAYHILPHRRIVVNSDYHVLLNWGFSRRLKQFRPDVIIACGWDQPATMLAPFIARSLGIPYVLWSGSTAGEPNWRRTVSSWLVRKVIARADAFIAYGSRAQNYLESLGAPASQIVRAYNTVETKRFRAIANETDPSRIRKELGLADGPVLLFSGQLIDRKGLPDLLSALELLRGNYPDLTLLVAGSGDQGERYQARCLAQDLGARVQFLGFVDRGRLAQLYASVDLCVLPSHEEVWGLVLNEAMACGTPVLTTNATGASADLVEDGVNGYVVPPDEPAALAAAMRLFLGLSESDRAKMRAGATATADRFTLEAMVSAFVEAVTRSRHTSK